MSIVLQIRGDGFVHDRIEKLISHFADGNKTAFGREIGTSTGVLASITGGRMSNPSFELLQKIITRYPQVNGDWLVMGRGQMLHDGAPVTVPAPPASELVRLTQEYMQVSKQLEGIKATYREAASDLAKLRAEVQNHEAIIQLQTEHLPNFGQEGREMLQNVIQQQQQDLKHARERHAAFLPIQERAEEELISALNYQGKLEKKLGEFISSVVPLTAEDQMNAISLRHQLTQAVGSTASRKLGTE